MHNHPSDHAASDDAAGALPADARAHPAEPTEPTHARAQQPATPSVDLGGKTLVDALPTDARGRKPAAPGVDPGGKTLHDAAPTDATAVQLVAPSAGEGGEPLDAAQLADLRERIGVLRRLVYGSSAPSDTAQLARSAAELDELQTRLADDAHRLRPAERAGEHPRLLPDAPDARAPHPRFTTRMRLGVAALAAVVLLAAGWSLNALVTGQGLPAAWGFSTLTPATPAASGPSVLGPSAAGSPTGGGQSTSYGIGFGSDTATAATGGASDGTATGAAEGPGAASATGDTMAQSRASGDPAATGVISTDPAYPNFPPGIGGFSYSVIFDRAQADADLPPQPVPGLNASTFRLLSRGQYSSGSAYAARDGAGNICLVVFGTSDDHASSCAPVAVVAANGIQVSLSMAATLDPATHSVTSPSLDLLAIWQPDGAVTLGSVAQDSSRRIGPFAIG